MPALIVGDDWENWRHGPARERLEGSILPEFLRRQRWFAGKARTLSGVRIADLTSLGALPGRATLALLDVRFDDGGADTYLLPLAVATGPDAARLAADPRWGVATLEGPGGVAGLHDALADDGFCRALVDAIGSDRALPAGSGVFRGLSTEAFARARGATGADLPVRRSSAEQSNSAIILGDRLILKFFRRVEPGVNPDFEIGRFLTERARFTRVPETAGALEYRANGGEPSTVGILQGLVPNQGSGWEHALGELVGYYERAALRPELPPDVSGVSTLDLAATGPPGPVRETLGPALEDAATLGRRTAEMHLALACDGRDPAFAPQPLSAGDLAALASDIRAQVETTLAALRRTLDGLPGPARDEGRLVLEGAPGLLDVLERLRAAEPGSAAIRVHGDYHLGQVLRVDSDYIILDFEGEPARPLAKRREKQSPVKDVVGMLRSFDYAAFAGLFAAAADRPELAGRLEPWARCWQAWTSAAFLRSYLATAGAAPFLPRDRADLATWLAAYTLDKALYELLYELNNRPDWVRIPLRGIVAMLGRGGGGDDAPR